ncbi:GNAT family N-acetyltransferase [Streptomyces sp. NBC_01465]|uniref:GNAT family N-acetyltransferase n=1 Tax=Streptomyces sp. NBC_01465 TaxID=2903878 RepID=UPI002E32A42C|nr:GNAT family N-acetyltransferase [Streptomyces sp. NBC_01465]
MTLNALEQYYDGVPRLGARTEDFGALTLFVREGAGWPFYARPTLGWTGPAATAADVDRVRARQRELGVPEAFEWVEETTPALRTAVEASGIRVLAHPLMVQDPSAPRPAAHESVRILTADDPLLSAALAVPHVAFAAPGTAVGEAGPAELAKEIEARLGDGRAEAVAARIREGRTVVAAAVAEGTVLGSGLHNPLNGVTEVAAVGTLPSARRRGLGLAVTAALVAEARTRGVETVFLSADNEDVARLYGRLGFTRVATALIAEADAS